MLTSEFATTPPCCSAALTIWLATACIVAGELASVSVELRCTRRGPGVVPAPTPLFEVLAAPLAPVATTPNAVVAPVGPATPAATVGARGLLCGRLLCGTASLMAGSNACP